MPEGHTIHRLARRHARLLVGQRVAADSPQGRFDDGARLLDGRVLDATDAWGKHLFHRYDDLWLHVHLGLYGKFRDGVLPAPEPRGALRLRLVGAGRSLWHVGERSLAGLIAGLLVLLGWLRVGDVSGRRTDVPLQGFAHAGETSLRIDDLVLGRDAAFYVFGSAFGISGAVMRADQSSWSVSFGRDDGGPNPLCLRWATDFINA